MPSSDPCTDLVGIVLVLCLYFLKFCIAGGFLMLGWNEGITEAIEGTVNLEYNEALCACIFLAVISWFFRTEINITNENKEGSG